MPIYNCSLTEKSTRDCMQALFSPFLTSKESTSANNNASSLPQMPPAASISSPILQSPSMSSSSSNTPTSQRPIPDTTTIKTEEEQQQPSINENQNGAMEGLIQGDDDVVVARYPYGENGMGSSFNRAWHQV